MKIGELAEEIMLILSFNPANIADLKSIISKTLGYKYKSPTNLEFCVRRSCKELKNKGILNEKKNGYLTYQLSEKGKDYLQNLEAYRNLMSEISKFSIKGEKRYD